MAEKEEKYEHLKKYEKQSKTADDMIRMTDRTHREAFNAYESEFESDEGRGIDLEKAKDPEIRGKALKKMQDVYLNKAKKVLKASPTDKFEDALLMNAYAGVTNDQLNKISTELKEKLTFQIFDQKLRPQYMERITDVLKGAAGEHLKEEHVDDIVKYVKLEEKYDVDPTKIRKLDEAVRYLELDRRNELSKSEIKDEHKKKKAA